MMPGDPLEDTRDWSADELRDLIDREDEEPPFEWVYGCAYEDLYPSRPGRFTMTEDVGHSGND